MARMCRSILTDGYFDEDVMMSSYVLIFGMTLLFGIAVEAANLGGRIIKEDAEQATPGIPLQVELRREMKGPIVARTMTDDEGRFAFADVEAGEYGVTIRTPTQDDGDPLTEWLIPQWTPVVLEDAAPAQVEIVLPLGVSVRGRVTDHRGKPMSHVLIISPDGTDGYRVHPKPDGTFVYRGLPPNAAITVVALERPPKPGEQDDARYNYSIQQTVRTGNAHDDIIDLGILSFKEVPAEPNLKGDFVDTDGKSLPGVRVFSAVNKDRTIRAVLVSNNGRFEASLPEGTYSISQARSMDDVLKQVEVTDSQTVEVQVIVPLSE